MRGRSRCGLFLRRLPGVVRLFPLRTHLTPIDVSIVSNSVFQLYPWSGTFFFVHLEIFFARTRARRTFVPAHKPPGPEAATSRAFQDRQATIERGFDGLEISRRDSRRDWDGGPAVYPNAGAPPQFEVTAAAASDRSEGKTYAEACTWRLAGEMPTPVRKLRVAAPRPPLDCDLIFSSLPAEMAQITEEEFARAGYPVISNSSAYRMQKDVPLLIPEVNHEHLRLIEVQRATRGFRPGGFIVTNPNCSTVMLALALAPLHKHFGVTAVVVTTMQALSGAGYPGVASLDSTDNVLPHIQNEEEKIELETLKILGRMGADHIEPAGFPVSAQCHRVNVSDGHMGAVRVKLARRHAWKRFERPLPRSLRCRRNCGCTQLPIGR